MTITPWDDLSRPPLIIAEVGVNHNGDESIAMQLIAAAAEADADVVKFQTYRTDMVVSQQAESAPYQRSQGASQQQADMLRSYEFGEATWRRLAAAAADAGLGFMSTAFDPESLALVDDLEPVAHKVPSGEVTNLRFINALRDLGRPVVVSSGMASVAEVGQVVDILHPQVPIAILHCLTAYPAPLAEANLRSIPFLHETFDVPCGWSDHTTDDRSAIAAVALGAVIIERHITLDRSMKGPDHAASVDPAGFASYVRDLRAVSEALGTFGKRRAASEQPNAVAARRSWHARRELAVGTVIHDDDLVALRPEVGIPCSISIVGRRLAAPVAIGDPLMETALDQLGRVADEPGEPGEPDDPGEPV